MLWPLPAEGKAECEQKARLLLPFFHINPDIPLTTQQQPQFLSSGSFGTRPVPVMDLPLKPPCGNGSFVPDFANFRPPIESSTGNERMSDVGERATAPQ
ncbi:hypothetical protein [Sphingomonas lacusdianchii]|uniref:hypothetical protein n=1 Tax=Sphingomonas lacusdianchii TaxID=2917992 RepID=UPI001F570693|nr:hypothetical protein [Sphingomonas sp. JXJ CY 53]